MLFDPKWGDPFDPTTWPTEVPEYRIYLDASLERYAIVDAEDYGWAVQWCWQAKGSRLSSNKYAARSFTKDRNGVQGPRINATLWLHVEIMKRVSPRPTPTHQVDHKNHRTLDCRRQNLKWATPAENAANRRSRVAA